MSKGPALHFLSRSLNNSICMTLQHFWHCITIQFRAINVLYTPPKSLETLYYDILYIGIFHNYPERKTGLNANCILINIEIQWICNLMTFRLYGMVIKSKVVLLFIRGTSTWSRFHQRVVKSQVDCILVFLLTST